MNGKTKRWTVNTTGLSQKVKMCEYHTEEQQICENLRAVAESDVNASHFELISQLSGESTQKAGWLKRRL